MLIPRVLDGVQQYRDRHGIKDDSPEITIKLERPYKKTEELCGQVKNLKKIASGQTVKEVRKSTRIPRDIWSAGKYGLRIKQKLEAKLAQKNNSGGKSSWEDEIARFKSGQVTTAIPQGNSDRSRLIGLRGQIRR